MLATDSLRGNWSRVYRGMNRNRNLTCLEELISLLRFSLIDGKCAILWSFIRYDTLLVIPFSLNYECTRWMRLPETCLSSCYLASNGFPFRTKRWRTMRVHTNIFKWQRKIYRSSVALVLLLSCPLARVSRANLRIPSCFLCIVCRCASRREPYWKIKTSPLF